MRQVIKVWLENKPGALMRVVGVLSATGTNIERLLVTPSPHAAGTSTMTIVADVEPQLRSKFVQKINRLVNVLRAADVTVDSPDLDSMAAFAWQFQPARLNRTGEERRPAGRREGSALDARLGAN